MWVAMIMKNGGAEISISRYAPFRLACERLPVHLPQLLQSNKSSSCELGPKGKECLEDELLQLEDGILFRTHKELENLEVLIALLVTRGLSPPIGYGPLPETSKSSGFALCLRG